jgi:heptosyltransferase-2
MKSKKIVIRAPNWIGDSILALPALNNLKRNFPESELWIAANEWVKDFFRMMDLFEGVIPLLEQNSLNNLHLTARRLREFSFDLGILLTNSFGSALLFYLAKIPQRWGYKKDGRSLLLTKRVSAQNQGSHRHQAQYYLDLLSGLGLKNYSTEMKILLNNEELAKTKEWLKSQNIDTQKPLVVLNPGASYGPAKMWPASKYSELASLLQEKNDAQILVVGTEAEISLAERVAAEMSEKPFILSGKTDLSRLAAVISCSNLFISNDSGPMHLANALNIPVIALFGPTEPLRTGPYQEPYILFHKGAPCWPCSYRVCPFDHRCMMSITAPEVSEACQKFLQ